MSVSRPAGDNVQRVGGPCTVWFGQHEFRSLIESYYNGRTIGSNINGLFSVVVH
jgi:hypothetical protein